MPVPFPSRDAELLSPPDADETAFVARGLVWAVAPAEGLTPLQATLVQAVCEAMTAGRSAAQLVRVGRQE